MLVHKKNRQGASSILAILFLTVCAVLAISFTAMSDVNMQMSVNHRDITCAQTAAESGLALTESLIAGYTPIETAVNTVSAAEAQATFDAIASHIYSQVTAAGGTVNWTAGSSQLQIPDTIIAGDYAASFVITLELIPAAGTNPHNMVITSTGSAGGVIRSAGLTYTIQKDSEVLTYAIASRGRMWLTGDTTIHGDIFSSWDRPEICPFNMTDDSAVLGTINTIMTRESIEQEHPGYDSYRMETLNENGEPIDQYGNPITDNYADRWHDPDGLDEIVGYHEGINYEQPYQDMPGMDIDDYDTDIYNSGLTTISSSSVEIEYFPHVAGDYTQPSKSWSRRLGRHVYENQTFTNSYLPSNRNALFRNCTFEGVLYVDCAKSASSYYNNVRFEDCQFNGPVITDTPEVLKWQHNCLYFTGAATFQNTTLAEATILAPHFNVNLGNTNSESGDNNVLTGAIVGGIVDVRGNAQIYGTIISMCDTTQWSSGYVTNIGATLEDGGSETTEQGDVGVIEITPDTDQMLPSGIITPIVLAMEGCTYVDF